MKLRLTAFSINSIDMKIEMMLRRKRKPVTPSANSTALSSRYQDKGTALPISVELLSSQHDRAQDRNQDQHAGDFEGQQIRRKQRTADLEDRAAFEAAEMRRSRRIHALHKKGE